MATEEELEEARVKEKDNSAKYYVIVNYSSNVVTVYEKMQKEIIQYQLKQWYVQQEVQLREVEYTN